jgi:hypothetical protein
MLDCLIDYIGFINCASQNEPESGLYINTLPGISLESVDKIANSEQITYSQVWGDAQTEAAIRFKVDFSAELNKCYTLSSKCDYEDMICDNIEHLVVAWRYLLGNQLMLYRITSTRLNRFTTVDKKQAEELAAHYQVEYEKALQLAMKLIDISSCCKQECKNNPTHVVWLP